MKPSTKFAKDILVDVENHETKSVDHQQESPLSQIGFEIESGLTRLDVSVKTLEILLEIEEKESRMGHKLTPTLSERQRRVANFQLNPSSIHTSC